jgi:hypothetical protein
MKSEDQIIADWLLRFLPDMKIPVAEGANSSIVIGWLKAIAEGKRVFTDPVPLETK